MEDGQSVSDASIARRVLRVIKAEEDERLTPQHSTARQRQVPGGTRRVFETISAACAAAKEGDAVEVRLKLIIRG